MRRAATATRLRCSAGAGALAVRLNGLRLHSPQADVEVAVAASAHQDPLWEQLVGGAADFGAIAVEFGVGSPESQETCALSSVVDVLSLDRL